MTRRTIFTVLVLMMTTLMGWAQPSDGFQKAAQAITAEDDRAAVEILEKLNQSEGRSFGSIYNEGLAWRNLDDLPRSRAAFEQALIISPRDFATRRRLQEVKGRLDPKRQWVEVRETPWWTLSEAQILLLFPGLVLVGLSVVGRIRRQAPSTKVLLGCVFCGLTVAGVVLATAPFARRAVVVASGTQLLPEPVAEKTGEAVPAGQLVDIVDHQQHFVEIRMGDGKTGWVRSAQLIEITPPENTPGKVNGSPRPEAQKDERSVPVWPATPRESPSR